MKWSIILLILATVLLFDAVFCNHEYRNHHRGHHTEAEDDWTYYVHNETNVNDTSLPKNDSESLQEISQQGYSFEDFKRRVGLGVGAIVSIPIVSVIAFCCCCYWCCKCCCDACKDEPTNIVVMNANEREAPPPPQIILQPIPVQPQVQQFQQTQYIQQPLQPMHQFQQQPMHQFQQQPMHQFQQQPMYAPPLDYSVPSCSTPPSYKY